MKKIMLFLILAIASLGCSILWPQKSAQPKQEPGTCVPRNDCWFCNNYVVEFVSDPPGARIEVDQVYLGETPFKQTMNGEVYMTSFVIIVAYPTRPGGFVQRKFLFHGQMFPHKIYFNMTSGPQTSSIDANVNQE